MHTIRYIIYRPAIAVIYCAMLLHVPVYSQNAIIVPVQRVHQHAYISEYDMRNVLPIQSSFDIILQKGRLVNNRMFALYQVGMSVALVNDMIVRSEYPIIRSKGEILIPLDMAFSMVEALLVHHQVIMQPAGIVVKRIDVPKEKRIAKNEKIPAVTKDAIGFIVIDAGHGGKDPGAVGKGGVKEKVLVLQISKLVSLNLQRQLPGIEVVMTRTTDTFLELGERTEIANRMLKKGVNGIFVSIHCNAAVVKQISGFETYYLSQNPSNEDARTTAVLENNVIMFEDPVRRKRYDDVEFIEALMLTTQIQKESSMLAASIQKALDKNIDESKSKGVKRADFFVLRGCLMPSALVEVGFITNEREKNRMKDRNYQKKLARGISDGIVEFIRAYNEMIQNN